MLCEAYMEASAVRSNPEYEISFRALTDPWSSMSFPCDATGCVNFDLLSTREKNNYLFARGMMGRGYAAPAVKAREVWP